MKWKFNDSRFEYELEFNDVSWPWFGHRIFGYDLVANLKPKKVVELGTHYGTSFWSFSQAVKDGSLETELYAIDTWLGEKHATFYGEEVFEKVKIIKNKFYSDLKINLVRKTFDEAIIDFENKSIDILHIDGLHTYDAVRHDFENWLPKMKEDGIILFHDIKVREDDFGVYKLWEELRVKYSTIEFFHSFGLGVLFLNKEVGNIFKNLEDEFQMRYSYFNDTKKSQIIQQKDQQIQQKDQQIQQKEQEIQQKEQEIQQKEQKIQQKEQEIQQKDQQIQQREQEIETMKSSRFWKMREKYLEIKRKLTIWKKK